MSDPVEGAVQELEKARCRRCLGTGLIPSETCNDCVDCQDDCPECSGSGVGPVSRGDLGLEGRDEANSKQQGEASAVIGEPAFKVGTNEVPALPATGDISPDSSVPIHAFGSAGVSFLQARVVELNAQITALRVEQARLQELAERLKQEAQIHAQEARTQRATVHECYQAIGAKKGDWNGAEPIRAYVQSVQSIIAERDALKEELARVDGERRAAGPTGSTAAGNEAALSLVVRIRRYVSQFDDGMGNNQPEAVYLLQETLTLLTR
jgi:hypothetical protein